MTKKNLEAFKILYAWAMRVKGQTELERRTDIAVSEECPDGSDLVSEY